MGLTLSALRAEDWSMIKELKNLPTLAAYLTAIALNVVLVLGFTKLVH